MGQLNRSGYQKLIDENIEWLEQQPRTLERDHTIEVLRWSVDAIYGPEKPSRRDVEEASFYHTILKLRRDRQERESNELATEEALRTVPSLDVVPDDRSESGCSDTEVEQGT